MGPWGWGVEVTLCSISHHSAQSLPGGCLSCAGLALPGKRSQPEHSWNKPGHPKLFGKKLKHGLQPQLVTNTTVPQLSTKKASYKPNFGDVSAPGRVCTQASASQRCSALCLQVSVPGAPPGSKAAAAWSPHSWCW